MYLGTFFTENNLFSDGKYKWTNEVAGPHENDKFESGIPWSPSATKTKACVVTDGLYLLDVDCDEKHAFVCTKTAYSNLVY